MRAEINHLANQILDNEPDAVVRWRLLRDVLRRPEDDLDLRKAQLEIERNHWVIELTAEQRNDGSWGAFHSRDTRAKQKVLITEMGVERAINLGLDTAHPILKNAAIYIRRLLGGSLPFPDRHEKNDRWNTGQRLFTASTYSRIHPQDPLLNPDRDLWYEIAYRTFQSGAYSADDESRAHAELTGASVKDSYLVLCGKYQLTILGSMPGSLSRDNETLLLDWLWALPEGIGYLNAPLNKPPALDKPGYIDRWLASMELLARLFPTWTELAQVTIEWIWDQRRADGCWDFGPRPPGSAYLPLSDSWRKKENRVIDWSTRILVLLQSYVDRTKH